MRKTVLIYLTIVLIILCSLAFYSSFNSQVINIRFDELRPLKHDVGVFYKGIKVGRIVSIKHSDNLSHTIVKVAIRPKDIALPSNIKAELRVEKSKKHEYDYIELIQPSKPTGKLCKGCFIKGESLVDFNSYFSNQNKESLDGIKNNLYESTENLNTTIKSLNKLINNIDTTLVQNQKNITDITDNIKDMTAKVNNALSSEVLDNSINDIQETLDNIKKATDELSNSANDVSVTTNKIGNSLPNTIEQTENIIRNVDEITCGVATTLKKPFGGLRIIFGKTITKNQNCTCQNKN